MKKIFKIITFAVFFFIFISLGFFIYFAKPYIIEINEVRTTGKLETVHASWGRACGEEFLSEGYEGTKLRLVVPEGGITPEDTNAIVSDNEFVITGYRYKKIHKNFLTGEIIEKRSQRFDIIKWHAVTPYEVYVKNKDVLTEKTNKPLGWQSPESEPKFASYSGRKSGGC